MRVAKYSSIQPSSRRSWAADILDCLHLSCPIWSRAGRPLEFLNDFTRLGSVGDPARVAGELSAAPRTGWAAFR